MLVIHIFSPLQQTLHYISCLVIHLFFNTHFTTAYREQRLLRYFRHGSGPDSMLHQCELTEIWVFGGNRMGPCYRPWNHKLQKLEAGE